MADVPVYMLANFEIHDADTYRVYEKGFFPILKKHGGRFHTFDDASETLEGDDERAGRFVIFQFPSEEAARAWWADPEYQALSEHRRAGTKMKFLQLVHGLPPRA
ncbi:MAG: hypothetical protein CL908_05445 [Deltaproteobacteria bacterium]|jgi:uncharacterized protein (DUF1330 family)|nr:hypothetical protein [Deltaproteobacteria bacterium]